MKKKKARCGIVVAMNKRHKSGAMKNKKDKRKNGKNKQQSYMEDDY